MLIHIIGCKIFVHCYSGISRSATFVIAYLIEKLKIKYEDAYTIVKTKRNVICPNEGFMEQLRIYEKNKKHAKLVDEKFDRGEDALEFFDEVTVDRPYESHRINLELPYWMLQLLDVESTRLGVPR